MSIVAILCAGLIVGGVGILIGFFLGFFGEKFKVEVDGREAAIIGVLPGNNCGGCGYPGCAGLANAIINGDASVSQCPVGGASVSSRIADIMGVVVEESERMVAFVKCAGTCEKANKDYVYTGNEECTSMGYVPNGGPKSCNFGCLGYGTCVKACPFNAIHIIDGIAVVDKEACKACGKCIGVCPKHLIEFVPYKAKHMVRCNAKAKGKEVIKVCSAGCIACRICEKNCPSEAICVEDNIAHIDHSKCTNCGICAAKCPKKIII